MAIAALQKILERIDTWPEDKQVKAAAYLTNLELDAEGDDELQVSDEDLAEIDRRIADVDAPTMSLEEFRERFRDYLR